MIRMIKKGELHLWPITYESPTTGAKNNNFEARNPKFETISNAQNKSNSKRDSFEFDVLDFPDFSFICSAFVSDFDIRISDFCPLDAISLVNWWFC